MDERLILPGLLGGYALVVLGIWGAVGRPWWLWPLAGGVAVLVVFGVYALAWVREQPEPKTSAQP